MATFTNLNDCRSGVIHITSETQWVALSGGSCSEVIVMGPTDGVWIFDTHGEFFVPANTSMTFRGVTNATGLSARSATATDRDVYYRTQFYGSMVHVVG